MSSVVPRFSRLAFGAVITILVTGTFQSWRSVRSTAALTETTYGRLLIVKVVLFAVLVGLGALSRRVVQARYRVPAARLSFGPGAATDDPDRATVASCGGQSAPRPSSPSSCWPSRPCWSTPSRPARRWPSRSAPRCAASWSGSNVTVDPAKAGPTDLHIYTLSPTGSQQEVQDLTARFTLPSNDVGPLTVPVQRAGPGHFSAYNFNLPLRGQWKLEVKALLSDIDEATLSTTIPVK